MAYLIFNSKEEAMDRSAEAGKQKNLSHWTTGKGTKFWWGWTEEGVFEDPKAYIEIVRNYSTDDNGVEYVTIADKALLSEEEIEELVDELPTDWQFPKNPFIEDEDDDDPPLAD